MQQQFDWTRAEQLGLLERAVLPRRPGVSSAALKSVLKAIDGFGRGREAWPSEATLAQCCGFSERTVRRALAALVELSLLIVQRHGGLTLNHYRVVWTELALLAGGNRHERPAMVSERPDTVSERPAMVAERPAMVAAETSEETYKETTTTGTAESVVVFLDELRAAGLVDPERTLRTAQKMCLGNNQIAERLAAWQALPDQQRRPGVLYNWLTKPGSYQATTEASVPRLRLAKLPDSAAEIRRADLIQYGRRQGWSHQQLQMAVERFEQEARRGELVIR
jgi:AraC-like DNA-binding protein